MNIIDFSDFLNNKFQNRITIISNYDKFKYRDYIDVNCKLHGDYKIRYDHLKDYGCPKCFKLLNKEKNKNNFIERSNIKHNHKYDYSKVNYKTNKDLVEIVCKKHGSFLQRPDNHLSGSGCTYCNYKVSGDDFINRSKIIHSGKYNYDKCKFIGVNNMITINCKLHGDFTQRASSHLSGSGCPICRESKGEKIIRNYLIDKKIEFVKEKKFLDFNKYIEFDFYLPNYNLCIEYDGIQHFEPIDFFGGKERFLATQKTDIMKNKYCESKKINILRISYLDDIKSTLDKYFSANSKVQHS